MCDSVIDAYYLNRKNHAQLNTNLNNVGQIALKKNKHGSLLARERHRYAKIFSVDVIIRILSTLRENGRLNRTNLAGKTGLNYKQCVRYITLLQAIEWVRVIIDRNHYTVITERGIEIVEKLQNF